MYGGGLHGLGSSRLRRRRPRQQGPLRRRGAAAGAAATAGPAGRPGGPPKPPGAAPAATAAGKPGASTAAATSTARATGTGAAATPADRRRGSAAVSARAAPPHAPRGAVLAAGMLQPTGDGDVCVWPTEPDVVLISLASPDRARGARGPIERSRRLRDTHL